MTSKEDIAQNVSIKNKEIQPVRDWRSIITFYICSWKGTGTNLAH